MFTGSAAGALSGVSPTDEGKEDAHQREEEEVEDSRPCKTEAAVHKIYRFQRVPSSQFSRRKNMNRVVHRNRTEEVE